MKDSKKNIDWRSVCPISSALDILGDKWSLLIVRDLIIHKTRTYSQLLESYEKISTNILASRLELLTCLKIIEREDSKASSRNNAYRLTKSGLALRPVLEALSKWSGSYLSDLHPDMVKIL